MALIQPAGLEAGVVRKGAILGALSLYLDFFLIHEKNDIALPSMQLTQYR